MFADYTPQVMNPTADIPITDNSSAPGPEPGALASNALARRGAPIPSALSSRFASYIDTRTRPYIFTVIVIGAIGYSLFAVADYIVVPDVFWTSLLLRALFLGLVMVLTKWLVDHVRNIYLLEVAGAFFVHVSAAIWFVVLFQSSAPVVGVYAFSSVIFLLWLNVGSSARFTTAVISSCSLSTLLFAGVWWLNQDDWILVFIYSALHLSILVLGLVVSWYNNFYQRRLFLHGVLDEIKNTELQQANRLLWSQAHTDPLTGLPNRPLLHDRLNQALAVARREDRKVALLFVDLDQFKPVNDQFGHAAGDRMLQLVAARMMAIIRDTDTVARVGGDEFVVVLAGIRSADESMAKASELIHAVGEPFSHGGREIIIGCSVGVAIFPEHGEDPAALQQVADRAVYSAKAAGRNRAQLGG